ncbi:MAG TPA: hypothetical protein VF624_09205 [Tepidisphaeraceae bacterium]|jgi:hypothetical protein
MHWDFVNLVEVLAQQLAAGEQALREEQAVYGLDSLDELQLHERLAAGLVGQYAVAREVHYPSTRGRKLTHRKRCDLVLAPLGRPLRLDSRPPDLFDPPQMTEPADALWLEMKCAYQYREGGRRHGGYGAQWRGGVVRDLEKMENETEIRHAALAMVVFTHSREMFDKDVELLEDVLAVKGVLAGFRQTRSVPIWERMGHRFASIAVWPTIQR